MHKCLQRCKRHVRGFLIRAGILLISIAAIFVVMVNTGEIVTLAVATERIAEALGAAAADTLTE